MSERQKADTQTKVPSVAHDLVNNVIGGKHWTWKMFGWPVSCIRKHWSKCFTLQDTQSPAIAWLDWHYHVRPWMEEVLPWCHLIVYPACMLANSTLRQHLHKWFKVWLHISYNSTHVEVWQCWPEGDMIMTNLTTLTKESLWVRKVMDVFPANMIEDKVSPKERQHKKKWSLIAI